MKGPVTKSPSQLAIVNLNEAFAKTLRSEKDRSEHSSSTSGSSVSFSTSMEKIHPALHRTDYTEEERAATWYNMLELKSIKIERRQIVRQMENGEMVDCSRGLESKTRQGCRMRQRAIIQAIGAVLDEQEEQIIRCSSDPEALAQVYSMYTQDSQKLAVERALQDQQETPIPSLS